MHCGVCCAFNPMNAFGRVIANNLINVYLKRAVLTYFDRYSSCTEDLFDERFSEWTALVSMQRAFELNSVSFWMLFAFSIVSEQAVTHMTRHEFLFTRFFFLHIFFSESLRRWGSNIEQNRTQLSECCRNKIREDFAKVKRPKHTTFANWTCPCLQTRTRRRQLWARENNIQWAVNRELMKQTHTCIGWLSVKIMLS